MKKWCVAAYWLAVALQTRRGTMVTAAAKGGRCESGHGVGDHVVSNEVVSNESIQTRFPGEVGRLAGCRRHGKSAGLAEKHGKKQGMA